MSSSPSKPVDPPAPYTGTLLYPALSSHHPCSNYHQGSRGSPHRAATVAAEDEGEEEEQLHIIVDISQAAFSLDSARWKADTEALNPGMERDANSLRHFEDLRGAEKALFRLSIKAQQVIKAAIKFRKERRGEPAEDPNWRKDEALLDLLEFITKQEHEGHLKAHNRTFHPINVRLCPPPPWYQFGEPYELRCTLRDGFVTVLGPSILHQMAHQ